MKRKSIPRVEYAGTLRPLARLAGWARGALTESGKAGEEQIGGDRSRGRKKGLVQFGAF